MVIDNKITGETKKKPPRDYSPEDDGMDEVPEQAMVLEEPVGDKKPKTETGLKNLQEAIKQDQKELKMLRKKERERQKEVSGSNQQEK